MTRALLLAILLVACALFLAAFTPPPPVPLCETETPTPEQPTDIPPTETEQPTEVPTKTYSTTTATSIPDSPTHVPQPTRGLKPPRPGANIPPLPPPKGEVNQIIPVTGAPARPSLWPEALALLALAMLFWVARKVKP